MTLSQTATLTKRTIAISIILLVLTITGVIGYNFWTAYNIANLPLPEEKPDTKFGLLPPPDFPQASVSSSNYSYSIDTTTGILPSDDPNFEKLVKVYFVIKTFASFLSGEKSQDLAQKFGIITSPQILSETNYRFSEGSKSLRIDLDSGNFVYVNENTSSAQSIDADEKLIADFKKNLQILEVFKEDLEGGPAKVTPLDTDNTVQISLWPAAIDEKPILYADFNKSQIAATVLGSADSLENYLSLNFTYYPIDTSTFATYPTKSTQEAFADLQNGKGVVIIEPKTPQVSITSIYLAYFLPQSYSPYLQPIFVFEGPQFVAYVTATK